MALLTAYSWPGNVRQLENAVFRAVVLADGDEITVAEFPQIAAHARKSPAGAPETIEPSPELAPVVAAETISIADDTAPREEHTPLSPFAAGTNALPVLDAGGDVRALDEIEADVIRFAIAHYRGQMSEVARRLRIGRSTLYRKLDGLGLSRADESSASSGVVAE
jgi:DNA-binding NtrC family response regulator